MQNWNDRLIEEGAAPGAILDRLSIPVTLARGGILVLAPGAPSSAPR